MPEKNENEDQKYQNLCETKNSVKRKFYSILGIHQERKGTFINNLMEQLNKIESDQQNES